MQQEEVVVVTVVALHPLACAQWHQLRSCSKPYSASMASQYALQCIALHLSTNHYYNSPLGVTSTHHQYGAYRDIERANYQFGGAGLAHFVLVVDRAQSDAYAPPSRAHVEVPYSVAAFPAEYMTTPTRKAALADFLARVFSK